MSGSALFKSRHPKAAIQKIREAYREHPFLGVTQPIMIPNRREKAVGVALKHNTQLFCTFFGKA